jgi:uncharacterized protein
MEGVWEAAEDGNLGEVQRLVGEDPGLLNARDEYDETPLSYASIHGHVELVQWLVDQGAAVAQRNDYGRSPLWFACKSGHAPVVRLLLTRGADPTIADNSPTTPLVAASSTRRPEIVRLLLTYPGVKASSTAGMGSA